MCGKMLAGNTCANARQQGVWWLPWPSAGWSRSSCVTKMKYTCTIDCQQHSTATTMRQIHQSAVGDCTSLHSDAAADNACCLQDKNLLAVRLPTLACVCVDITQLFQHVRLAVEVLSTHGCEEISASNFAAVCIAARSHTYRVKCDNAQASQTPNRSLALAASCRHYRR